ncbi:MAG TPA: alpha/beta hydrolase [Burkholderiaceae bacterium]|nr:alpha/beta hydrolase [Burkholderiaceae bacterium]
MRPFEFNTGEQPRRATVVLLHSSASSSRQWGALAERLAPRFDVRTLDFHGHGARDPWAGNRPLTLVDDAALVAPILGEAGPVHLVGHSYGGAVALKVAAMWPGRIASVAVYEPVLFRWLFAAEPDAVAAREPWAVAAAMRSALNRGEAQCAAERFLDYWGGTGTWVSMSQDRQASQAARMRSVLAHFDALARDVPSGARLRGLRMPMLFLSGAATVASTARIAALLRSALPAARHLTLPGAGHLGPITHPDVVNDAIEHFLARADAGTAAVQAMFGKAA